MRAALSAAVFAVSFAWLLLQTDLAADFHIDEAHKISETYYLGLIANGDFNNPDWTSSAVERANPIVGKAVFGIAMQLAGVPLPADGRFAMNPDPRGRPEALRTALKPARIVSLLATAGTSALVCFLAGPVASLLFLGSFLTLTYGGRATFDPLLTFFVVAAAVPLADRISWPRTITAASLAALAFGTRASGIIALAGVLVLLRSWRMMVAAVGICLAFATIVNPYYWVPSDDFLPVRIVRRYITQFRDLADLLRATGERRLSPLEKLQFTSEYAFGDLAGLAILAGILLLAIPTTEPRRPLRILLWCAAIVVAFVAWLPVGYPRYVLLVVPPLAVAAAVGYRHALVAGGHFVSARRRKT